MPLPKERKFTSGDYWQLPEGTRAELIDGQLYDMAPPGRLHQKIVMELSAAVFNHIRANQGGCQVYPAPFAVNLDAADRDWVEPDVSVICDPKKLTDRGCAGAPDLIFEVVSPSSRRMDYNIKTGLYAEAGVREYWIVDPVREHVTVYYFEEDAAPVIFSFSQDIPVRIYQGLMLNMNRLLNE